MCQRFQQSTHREEERFDESRWEEDSDSRTFCFCKQNESE
jgi:hypothetical protein